jgi:hypothetical protein
MAINQSHRMHQIVRVAEVRKQRAANAAAEARRTLAVAEEERASAAEQVRAAQAALRDAGEVLLHSPSSEQMLIWRNHCAALKDLRIAQKEESDHRCTDAKDMLVQSVKALQRQDLRHDHLAEQEKLLRHQLARVQEARSDDETQGCGQPAAPVLQ